MSESDSIDARWLRERRRVGIRSGLSAGALLIVYKLIERTGVLAPIFGADVAPGGPFTVRWLAALAGGALIAAALAAYASQWTVAPPREAPSDT